MDFEQQQRYQMENPNTVLRPVGFQPNANSMQREVPQTLIRAIADAQEEVAGHQAERARWWTGKNNPSVNEQAAQRRLDSLLAQVDAEYPAPQDVQELANQALAQGVFDVDEVISGLPPDEAAQITATDRMHLQRLLGRR